MLTNKSFRRFQSKHTLSELFLEFLSVSPKGDTVSPRDEFEFDDVLHFFVPFSTTYFLEISSGKLLAGWAITDVCVCDRERELISGWGSVFKRNQLRKEVFALFAILGCRRAKNLLSMYTSTWTF